MVDFPIDTGIRKIGDSITTLTTKLALVPWFTEDITVLLSSANVLATLVVDFAFSVPTVVEYTLDGTTFIAFNNGDSVTGGQSRFIDVTTGSKVNFRAINPGDIIRCIVSSVP